MSMSQATLEEKLLSLEPTDSEEQAINTLVEAYSRFASDAQALTQITEDGVSIGKSAMTSALAGMSSPDAGITIIPSAVFSFWDAVASDVISFAGAISITPPPHASLPASFASLVATLTSSGASLEDAAEAIAAIMYNDAIVGGTVTTAGPVVTPIT